MPATVTEATPEIAGAGSGRTGTESLRIALNRLGFGSCHHMHEVIATPALLPDWQAAATGAAKDWHAVFGGWRA